MKIQVISRGRKKNGMATAQIVVHLTDKSITKHVWQREGRKYSDYLGLNYDLQNNQER